MPGARETTAVAPLMLARWHPLEAHLRLQGPDSAHLLVVEVTGQASLVWTRVEYAGRSGGFGQPAQVVLQEREPMTDWMPSHHGVGFDAAVFGARGWLCELGEARFGSGPSELLDVRLGRTADEGCIGHRPRTNARCAASVSTWST
jgi:hypothetical protein